MQTIFNFVNKAYSGQAFRIGVPLPQGKHFNCQNLCLHTDTPDTLRAHLRAITLWPDKSIKWLYCEGVVVKDTNAPFNVYLDQFKACSSIQRQNWIEESSSQIGFSTKRGEVIITTNGGLLEEVGINYLDSMKIRVKAEFNESASELKGMSTEYESVFDHQGTPLYCTIVQQLQLQLNSTTYVRLELKYRVYYETAYLEIEASLLNPQAIVHHGGKWDLGNESSIYINSFALQFDYDKSETYFQINKEDNKHEFNELSLMQYSSGGKNWNSDNHKTRKNRVSLKKCGASLSYVDQAGKPIQETIKRPSPSVSITQQNQEFFIQTKDFWQAFPTLISSNREQTIVDFAPQNSFCEVELQAGEIKHHRLYVGSQQQMLKYPIEAELSLCQSLVVKSKAIPFISDSSLAVTEHSLLVKQQNELYISANEWFDKREKLDEYGWRNFGDIYADHEAAQYSGNNTFVSHYNNQYDPLHGFLTSWITSGNPIFKKLADELYRHIVNIDIYNTDADKPEYNNGLFWHTDHYVPAETATHRTYSIHQAADVYMDHAGGGGPGPHHCYSSGLALYYLLTGEQRASSATQNLCKWMNYVFEGDDTVLGLLLRIKNANYLKFPFSQKLILGSGTGVIRNIFNNKYPLDRGTGNLVNVLLDSFLVSGQTKFISQAEFVIKNTISASDEIRERHFEDIENTWFYTVFLQAVSKYLWIVSQFSVCEVDSKTISTTLDIVQAFLHYTTWMAENEKPYLANHDKLEYPNDTWTGQDLRKIQLLFCAYDIDKSPLKKLKAIELKSITVDKLSKSEELSFTRIQALLMQNNIEYETTNNMFVGLQKFFDTNLQRLEASVSKKGSTSSRKSIVARSTQFLKNYSLKRELDLLCVRIPAAKKILKR